MIDEAQRLNGDCIELLRHLHDHPHTRFALLYVGGDGCWEVLSREPMLASRYPPAAVHPAEQAGKPPHAARREHVSALSWEYGQAWLAGSGVTDLIVDRAHLLTRDQADAAAVAATKAGTALWLLWGTGIDPYTPGYDGAPHLVAGARTPVISLWEFYQRLPAAAPPLTAVAEPGEPGDWPPLPAADFPTFLAACRRYLPRREFAQVARLYYDTAEAADAWLDARRRVRGQPAPGRPASGM